MWQSLVYKAVIVYKCTIHLQVSISTCHNGTWYCYSLEMAKEHLFGRTDKAHPTIQKGIDISGWQTRTVRKHQDLCYSCGNKGVCGHKPDSRVNYTGSAQRGKEHQGRNTMVEVNRWKLYSIMESKIYCIRLHASSYNIHVAQSHDRLYLKNTTSLRS